jgi:hypothetical protein
MCSSSTFQSFLRTTPIFRLHAAGKDGGGGESIADLDTAVLEAAKEVESEDFATHEVCSFFNRHLLTPQTEQCEPPLKSTYNAFNS